jgi:hypothetical protein
MRKWICLFAIVILAGCKKQEVKIYFTSEKALKYFSGVEAICNNDAGKLWGKNLYGPLMFVDRPTRKIFANQPDAEGILKLKDGVYSGIYPKELIINTSGIEFGGTLFAMALLPPQEDTFRINTGAIHGLFHCFQKKSGLEPTRFRTRMMDDKNSRLWLKLEWKALRNAVNSTGEQRTQSIRDALIFREARREYNPAEINDENKFENYEGLSSMTYFMLCTNSIQEMKLKMMDYLDRIYKFQSYSRSYGTIHGALYGFLANEQGYDFKSFSNDSLDLGGLVKDLYQIQLPEICRDVAGSLALGYDVESIYREEEQRLADIKESKHRQISVFTDKPVLYLELESPYFDFEPENIRSLDTLGTIYTAIRVADNWGKLTVDKGGCLVSYNLRSLRITAKNFKESKNHYYGDGWHLILNSDWEVVKMDGNYFVRKLMP